MKTLALTISACVLGVIHLQAGKPSMQEQQKSMQAIVKTINDKHYTINTEQATGMTGSSVAISGSIKIDGDKCYSALPYFGGSTSGTFGSEAGLRYEGSITEYRIEQGKKGQTYIYMTVEGPNSKKYAYKIEVFHNRTVFLSVSSTNLEPMRYSGNINFSDN